MKEAKDANLKHLVIIGETQDGDPFHASSVNDVREILYMLKFFEHSLFD